MFVFLPVLQRGVEQVRCLRPFAQRRISKRPSGWPYLVMCLFSRLYLQPQRVNIHGLYLVSVLASQITGSRFSVPKRQQ